MATLTSRKWFYPLVYLALVIIALLPLYTERPYDPRDTSAVMFEIIQRATLPYAAWGWVFHVLTLAVIGLAVWKPETGGRAVAAYFGLKYLVIAATQTRARTPTYGYAVHTGALVAEVLLGLLWLWVAWKGGLVLWTVPERMWLGVMHLPLLVVPTVALVLTHFAKGRTPER